MRTGWLISSFFYFILSDLLFIQTAAKIWDINYKNMDKVLEQKKLLILLFYSSGCNACIKAVPEFQKSSDKFDHDPNVLFGMVDVMKDTIMSLRFNIRFVPIVNYYPYNKNKQLYSGLLQDYALTKFFRKVTVESFSKPADKKEEEKVQISGEDDDEEVSPIKEDAKKQQSIELDLKDFESIVLDKTKHCLLSLYTPECEEECELFEEAAYIFRNEEHIQFVRLNVAKTPKKVVDHFQVRRNPTLVWFPIRDKEFGTKQSHMSSISSYISFLNHHAGTRRRVDGSLDKNAGRIPKVDQIIDRNIHDIINGINVDYVLDQCDKMGREYPGAPIYLKYYLTLLRELKKGTPLHDVLHREQTYLAKKLKKKNSTIKDKEAWNKFTNIINVFVDAATNLLLDPSKAAKKNKIQEENLFEEEPQSDSIFISATKIPSGHDEL